MAEGNGAYLYVKNWSKFQHYKNRSPTWIKLYCSILTDPQFEGLPDHHKAHLILIWLMAARYGGMVPNDPKYLRRHLGLHSRPNVKLFINQGWLSENASNVLAQRREEEIREEKKGQKPVDKSLERSKIKGHLPDYLYKLPTQP